MIDYRLDVIDSLSGLKEITPEWLAFLETKPFGGTVFNDPLYLKAFLENDVGKMNETLFFVLLRENGELRCIAPIYIRPYRFALSFASKRLCSVAARKMGVFGNSFIYRDSPDSGEWFQAIFDFVFRSVKGIDFFSAELRLDGPFADYLVHRFEANHKIRCIPNEETRQNSYQILFPESYAALVGSYGRNLKKNIRENRNALEKYEPRSQFLCFTLPEDMEKFLESLDEIQKTSWKSATYGFTPWNVADRVAFVRCLASLGWVRGNLLLTESGKLMSFYYGLCYRDCFYAINTSYDPAYSGVSPGTNTLALTLEMLMRERPDIQYADLGFGALDYKVKWGNKAIPSLEVSFLCTRKGRILNRTQAVLNGVVSAVKKCLDRIGMTNRVRKYLKNKT